MSLAEDFPSGGFGDLIPMSPYMVKFSTATSKDALLTSGTIGSVVQSTDTGTCALLAVLIVISSASRLRNMIKSTFARNLASDRGLVRKNDIILSFRMTVDGLELKVMSIDDLIVNKRASGRPKDIADALALEKLKARANG